jgi:Asp-tRNA(Asn)/Glu-tRNA(Gln) amidotransferase A subunit family amidase
VLRRFIPGGSSSGSGAAVGGGLVSFALATDTAGSGRVPAGYNGCVGVKGTVGYISTVGEAARACTCAVRLGRGVTAGHVAGAAPCSPARASHRHSMQHRPHAPPAAGVVPACASLDCLTVLARTVEDGAAVARIMASADAGGRGGGAQRGSQHASPSTPAGCCCEGLQVCC